MIIVKIVKKVRKNLLTKAIQKAKKTTSEAITPTLNKEKNMKQKIRYRNEPIYSPEIKNCINCGCEIEHEEVTTRKGKTWRIYSNIDLCYDCEDAEIYHQQSLFDTCQYSYLPEEDNQEPIGDEYLVPMSAKTYNEYYAMLQDYTEAQDVPIDWGFERDLMKLQNPKKLPYIAPKKEIRKEFWTGKTAEEMRSINKSIDRHERRHNAI